MASFFVVRATGPLVLTKADADKNTRGYQHDQEIDRHAAPRDGCQQAYYFQVRLAKQGSTVSKFLSVFRHARTPACLARQAPNVWSQPNTHKNGTWVVELLRNCKWDWPSLL